MATLACAAASAHAGTGVWMIKTIAGNGDGTFSGDGGPAMRAGMTPVDVALDGRGNVYVSDAQSDSGRVRKISPNGRITTIAGGGRTSMLESNGGFPARSARLSTIVQAVAANTKGEVYLAQDGPDARVWKVGLDGIIRVVAGGGSSDADRGPATEMHLLHVGGLALDTRGNVFVSTANAVVKVSARGMATAVAGSRVFDARPGYAGDGGRATEARLAGPAGLATDGKGTLYIADVGNSRLRKVGPNGTITTFAIGSSAAVAVGKHDEVYFANGGGCAVPANHRTCSLRRFSSDGRRATVIAGGGTSLKDGPASAAAWGGFNKIAVDAQGRIYVVLPGLGYVRMVYRAEVSPGRARALLASG